MSQPRRRPWFLTLWLVLLIAVNGIAAFGNLARSGAGWQELPRASIWPYTLLAILALANVVFALALFRWKRWGFYGFCASAFLALIINLYVGLGVVPALAGPAGVIVLFALLRLGHKPKA